MQTAPFPDLYRVLGVDPSAGAAEINAAFRARAKQLHPDSIDGDADRFKELSLANAVLTDPRQRRRYDERRAATSPAEVATGTSAMPIPARSPAPMLATTGRARAALWGGLALTIVGIALAAVVPLLPEASKGTTVGRDLTLWISAAKLVVCGTILAVVGQRRLHRLSDQSAPGIS